MNKFCHIRKYSTVNTILHLTFILQPALLRVTECPDRKKCKRDSYNPGAALGICGPHQL